MREMLCCIIICACLLSSCVVEPLAAQPPSDDHLSSLQIVPSFIDWGYTARPDRRIDTIILHTINNPAAQQIFALSSILAILKEYQVAAHYVILRDGSIFQLVQEKDVAYHAGKSRLPLAPFRDNVNEFSIGIELANSQDSLITAAQYEASAQLVLNIKSRYEIEHVFGHKDIAPGRKTDPWNFDWERFHKTLTIP